MAAFCYQMTFIGEVAKPVAEVRAKSCPPVLKTLTVPKDASSLGFMHEQKRLALQVSKLQERSQLLSTSGGRSANETGAPRVQEIPSLGSYGHPNICRRPCILFVKGTCQKGSACGFCHLEHELRIPSFDKQQRDYLKHLPPATFLQMILPYVRKTVEASEFPGACQVLQLLESEVAVRAPAGVPTARRIPRRIRHVLGRMSLANLISVICLTLTGRFPKVVANELKDLRDTAQTLES